MPFTDAYDDTILNFTRGAVASAPAALYVALFNRSTPPTKGSGGTELAGGSYARQLLALGAPGAASPRGRQSVSSADLTFPIATAILSLAADPTQYFALFDAVSGGTMCAYGELLGAPNIVTVSGATFTCASHNLAANGLNVQMRVQDGSIPGNFAVDTEYYVVNRTSNTFELSATLGGAAITASSVGSGKITVAQSYIKALGIGDSLVISAGQLVLAND